jgi:hypothetical protein
VPATFKDQLAIVEELLDEVERVEAGEKRHREQPAPDRYESGLRLAGLAQRIAQAYTIMEGVLAFIARRIDRDPVAGENWHKKLIARCAQPYEVRRRPTVLSSDLAEDLRELCEFRHLVRNIYPTRLEETRVRENLDRLIRASRAFGAACASFARTVDEFSRGRARERRRARK